MCRPMGKVSVILRLNYQIESIGPVQSLIFSSDLVISIPFYLEMFTLCQVTAFFVFFGR